VVVAKDIEQGVIYQNGDFKVTAFTVDHALIKAAFGYRVDYARHSVVLSGDTRYSENLIHFAQGADVLIREVIDPEAYRASDYLYSDLRKQKVIDHHTTPEQAGTVFSSQAKAKLAVYSHIVPFDASELVAHNRKTYSRPLEVGQDLTSIDIGDKVEVHPTTK
jgi:ribonuclease Z